tara:strand:+ start:1821 stop:3707 length:1887 start_codon:yes stop_codon:yes gene_type:complete
MKTRYSKSISDAYVSMYEAKMSSAQIAKLKKMYEPMRDKRISPANATKLSKIIDMVGRDKEALIQLFKADIPFVSQGAVTKLITKHNMKGAEINKLKEEFNVTSVQEGLDNADKSVVKKVVKKLKGASDAHAGQAKDLEKAMNEAAGLADKAKKSGISVGILKKVYDRGLAAYKTGHRPGTTAPQWAMARVNSFITKGSGTWGGADKDLAKQAKGKSEEVEEDFFDPITEACWVGYKQVGMKNKGGKEVPNCVPEEVAEWVQVDIDEYYEMGTDEYKQYLKGLTPGEVEEGAASDARRAMSKDPEMRQRAFSKDVEADDDDRKAASKNIMMQMRKAQSLKGRFDVEFQDGKKVKIPAKIALEVQRKFASIRRSQDKQKFQAKVAKSYKSMLAALKESYDTSPRKIVEGTWSLPDTPSKKNEFKKLMKSKIKLGKEGDDASNALYSLVGDDELFDDLYTAGKKNPNGDARPVVKKHMKRLGIKEEVDLAEGRMKELHMLIQQGKSAKEIAKIMKLDVKTIKALMNSYVPEGKKKPVVFKGTPKQIKQQMKNLKKKDKIKIGEGDAEDRVRDKHKDQAMRDRDTKEREVERAKVQDFRSAQRDKKAERERKQRNEVLDRVTSKLKERTNG